MNKKNNAIALLAAASSNLILPCAQSAQTADEFSFGMKHHSYSEDSLPKSIGGSTDRYDINVNQFLLVAPISDDFDLTVSYQHENMSGASPWFTIKDAENKVVQVMSGASIKDTRKDVSLTARHVKGLNSFSLGTAFSDEDDYRSQAFSAEYARDSEDKLETYSISFDFSNDEINAVDAELYQTRPQDEEKKHSFSALGSYSQILTKNSIVQLGIGFTDKSGYLSDPYKMVMLNYQLIAENRPDSRVAKTLSLRYRHFFDGINAAFHADYRLYDDSWDILSNTFELAWYQNLPYNIQIIPSFRLYSQSDSYFYKAFYDEARNDGYYSTDYRLSEYGAYTYGLKLSKKFNQVTMTFNVEHYKSSGDYAFANADIENPALVDFKLISFGVNINF